MDKKKVFVLTWSEKLVADRLFVITCLSHTILFNNLLVCASLFRFWYVRFIFGDQKLGDDRIIDKRMLELTVSIILH